MQLDEMARLSRMANNGVRTDPNRVGQSDVPQLLHPEFSGLNFFGQGPNFLIQRPDGRGCSSDKCKHFDLSVEDIRIGSAGVTLPNFLIQRPDDKMVEDGVRTRWSRMEFGQDGR